MAMNMDRIEKAVMYHKNGFNCSQAVFIAFADKYGLNNNMSARLSCAFGGGIGRQGLTCGAVLAMCMLIGLEEGNETAIDVQNRKHCNEITKTLCDRFKKEYGSMQCSDIIGVVPCSEKVRLAAEIFEEYLESKNLIA